MMNEYKLLGVSYDEGTLSTFTKNLHVQVDGVMIFSTTEPCVYNELLEALKANQQKLKKLHEDLMGYAPQMGTMELVELVSSLIKSNEELIAKARDE
jgi:hypothetical protein